MNGEQLDTCVQDKRATDSGLRHSGQWLSGALLGLMVLSWSSGFIGYRYASEHSGVMVVTFWRFVAAFLLLLPIVARTLSELNRADLGRHVLVGLFGIAGYIAAIAGSIGLGVAPGTSSLIANLLPVTIVLSAGLVPGQRTRGAQWWGVGLCVMGMLIASMASVEFSRASIWAYCLPVLAVASLTAASLYQKRCVSRPVPPLTALFIQICATLPVFAVLAVLEGGIKPVMSAGFGLGIVWLVVFSTLGGYGFYWLCLQRFNVQTTSGALFLIPPVTMIWASLQFGDPLSILALVGVALTLLGLPLLRRPAQA